MQGKISVYMPIIHRFERSLYINTQVMQYIQLLGAAGCPVALSQVGPRAPPSRITCDRLLLHPGGGPTAGSTWSGVERSMAELRCCSWRCLRRAVAFTTSPGGSGGGPAALAGGRPGSRGGIMAGRPRSLDAPLAPALGRGRPLDASPGGWFMGAMS